MLFKRPLIILSLMLTTIVSIAGSKTRIILDAGHGGKDDGAVWFGVKESELNLKVAKRWKRCFWLKIFQ